MPNIINIHGPQACGKSTLFEKLQTKLTNYIIVDRAYLKKMLHGSGKGNPKRISKKAAFTIMKELVKLKHNILVQEVNPESINKLLRPYLKNYKYKVYSFFVQCSTETAWKRAIARKKKSPKKINLINRHKKAGKLSKLDLPLNTEEMSIQQSINYILKEIKK